MGSYYADYMRKKLAEDESDERAEERELAQRNQLMLQGLQIAGKTALDWRSQNVLESNLKNKGILKQAVGSQDEGTALYNEVTPDTWWGKAGQSITGKKTYEANPAIMTAIGQEHATETGRKAAFNLAYGGAQGKKLYDEWSQGAGATTIPMGDEVTVEATTDADIDHREGEYRNLELEHKKFVEKYTPREDTYFDDYDIDQEFPNQEIIVDPDAPMSTFGEWDSPPPIPLDKPAVDPKIDHSVIPILDEVKADLRKPSHDQVMNFGKGNLNVEAKNIGTEIDLEKQTVPNIKTQDGANVGDAVESMSNNVRQARIAKNTPISNQSTIYEKSHSYKVQGGETSSEMYDRIKNQIKAEDSKNLNIPSGKPPSKGSVLDNTQIKAPDVDIKNTSLFDKGKDLFDKGQDVLSAASSLKNISEGKVGAKEAVDIAKVGSKVLGEKAGQAVGQIAGQAGGALNVFSAGANIFDEESSAVSKVGSAMQLASAIPGVGQVVGGIGTALQLADSFLGGDAEFAGDMGYSEITNKGRDDYQRHESSNRAMKRESFRRRLRS